MNRVEEKLLYPQPGSRIDAARAYGIDLTLLVERLRRTPEDRVRDLQQAIVGLEAMRGQARWRGRSAVSQRPDAPKERD